MGFFVNSDGYEVNPYYTFWSYNTSKIVNPDGYKHTAWARVNGVVMMGFEDLYGLGDKVCSTANTIPDVSQTNHVKFRTIMML